MKIINIGIYPPPIGGISIYLQRLKEYLDIKGMDNVIIDISKYKSMEKSNRGVKNISWRKAVICFGNRYGYMDLYKMDRSFFKLAYRI